MKVVGNIPLQARFYFVYLLGLAAHGLHIRGQETIFKANLKTFLSPWLVLSS